MRLRSKYVLLSKYLPWDFIPSLSSPTLHSYVSFIRFKNWMIDRVPMTVLFLLERIFSEHSLNEMIGQFFISFREIECFGQFLFIYEENCQEGNETFWEYSDRIKIAVI